MICSPWESAKTIAKQLLKDQGRTNAISSVRGIQHLRCSVSGLATERLVEAAFRSLGLK